MSTRARQHLARVVARDELSPHLVRLRLGSGGHDGDGLAGFASTGVPDEWVGLVVPGQFQARYYTVRSWDGAELVLDVVVHDEGLVTGWARSRCVGDEVVVSDPRASFALPEGARWLLLVGDLTALPAIARIVETHASRLPVRVWLESPHATDGPDVLAPLVPDGGEVTWLDAPADGGSRLAEVVAGLEFPAGDGYFWMAGESAQMRAIRKDLMRGRQLPAEAYDVMGYWRAVTARQPRAVDPGPIWRAGKAAGKTDEQIWAEYDEARS